MKTSENMAFPLGLWAVGWSVGVKPRLAAMKPNKINGFVHESCGTALTINHCCPTGLVSWG